MWKGTTSTSPLIIELRHAKHPQYWGGIALGADTRTVLGMILRGALRMALLGIVIGAAVAFAVTRLMRELLLELALAIRSPLRQLPSCY